MRSQAMKRKRIEAWAVVWPDGEVSVFSTQSGAEAVAKIVSHRHPRPIVHLTESSPTDGAQVVRETRKLARLAQRAMAKKDYGAVSLCLALLTEVGTASERPDLPAILARIRVARETKP